jgi:ribonuclease VapC
MVIDTSALLEVYLDGPRASDMKAAIKKARGHRFMSAANYEAHVVLKRRFAGAQDRSRALLDKMIERYAIAIEFVQEAHARLAVDAYYRYGQGAGGGALNFGDCFAYALAKHRDDALLYIGNDFARTDVRRAV